MLSRVADSIYWMSRYIERAENIARIIDVNLHFILDTQVVSNEQWEPLVRITGDWEYFYKKYESPTRENVIEFLTFDTDYPNSIISCLSSARENARSIREIITLEMWEQINRFYLMLNDSNFKKTLKSSPHDFYNDIKLNSHLFFGITDNTMSHNESWQFYKLGQLIERADKTSRIIDVKYFHILPNIKDVGSTCDDIQWGSLLKSASGFEMYRKIYHGMTPEKIIEFLILDTDFPRSITYCLNCANTSLHAISGTNTASYSNKPEQLLGMLRSELAYADVSEIIALGLHEFIDSFQKKLNLLSDSIFIDFFAINNNMEYCLEEISE